jgi:site-specific DNA-methyltransferase (adenine-specific)
MTHPPISEVYHQDCMDFLKEKPDKFWNLAIVDPEFGIGISRSPRLVTDKGLLAKTWDDKPVSMDYFDELFRVSRHQIVWGGNYYNLGITKHCIIWDKRQPEDFSFGMFDFAWTSFDRPNKMFRYSVMNEQNKIHPTQKPVALYQWLLKHYAKKGDKILDTHLGSGSSRIAAYKMNYDFWATELDRTYFDDSCERFEKAISQPLFDAVKPPIIQANFFETIDGNKNLQL